MLAKYLGSRGGIQLLYDILKVFVVYWVKLCHAVRINFKWTQHKTWIQSLFTDWLSYFLDFLCKEGAKFIVGSGGLTWLKVSLVSSVIIYNLLVVVFLWQVVCTEMELSKKTQEWSNMATSDTITLEMSKPLEITKSKMCPHYCV